MDAPLAEQEGSTLVLVVKTELGKTFSNLREEPALRSIPGRVS